MEDDKETDEHEEVEEVDKAELKKYLVIVKDDDIAIDAIPLATKPPVIRSRHCNVGHRDMRKIMAFQTWLSKFPIFLDQLLDLEVLPSYSDTVVVEDQQMSVVSTVEGACLGIRLESGISA
ncbi:hypothetical protein Tco_0886954 [Tanacetum coccineum]